MKTYLWYVSATSRVIAQGEHQQAAFDTLDASDRAKIPMAEFCVEVDPTKNQHNAPYMELLELFRSEKASGTPVESWVVLYEARRQGAIGIFEPQRCEVTAPDQDTALTLAREQLNQKGYETRSPLRVKRWI